MNTQQLKINQRQEWITKVNRKRKKIQTRFAAYRWQSSVCCILIIQTYEKSLTINHPYQLTMIIDWKRHIESHIWLPLWLNMYKFIYNIHNPSILYENRKDSVNQYVNTPKYYKNWFVLLLEVSIIHKYSLKKWINILQFKENVFKMKMKCDISEQSFRTEWNCIDDETLRKI